MKIAVLAENTSARDDILAEHGLSLYLETAEHKILFDMGQTDLFAKNAQVMGIDLTQVDIAVLSHGHYDHGGGMARFLEINDKADVYVSKYAFDDCYSGAEKFIGINKELKKSPGLKYVEDYCELCDNVRIISCNDKEYEYPIDSAGLTVENDGVRRADKFRHEQYLLIKDNARRILISGCSHKGILNICGWFHPDVLVGGFHFMKQNVGERNEILDKSAQKLLEFGTEYYTCHCTGEEQYRYLKKIMNNKLNYLSGGQIIEI